LGDIANIREVQSSSAIKRVKGETVAVVQAKLDAAHNDQSTAGKVNAAVLDYYKNDAAHLESLGVEEDQIDVYSAGDTASTNKSFGELFTALLLAIIITYIVLVLFFGSFTQPLVILFTVPLSFVGIFPALRYLGNAQFGFLEIIGMIILIGIVENVAIFLIDAARQRQAQGIDEVRAISQAAGLRLRPVLLTKFTALASLAPLAILSETYRSISIVIIFGLLTSGFTSLITTPILYIFFRWLSRRFSAASIVHKLVFIVGWPIYLIVWGVQDRKHART
jgi:HAE1 family hydrophobic/amphiphilic exporter-1